MNRFHDSHLPSSAFRPTLFLFTSHLLLLTFLFVLPAFSQQTWERDYGGTGDDYGRSVQQTFEGGYIVTGNTHSFGNNSRIYLIKTNASGDTLWTRIYGQTGGDIGFSVQQTSDSGYIIAGCANAFGLSKVYLVKTTTTGDTLWTKTYGGTARDFGYSTRQTSDGGYIVAGYSYSFGNSEQVYLIKTNPSGDTLWTRAYGTPCAERGYSVRPTSDGGYIIAGVAYPDTGNNLQLYLIKTNASGDTLWTRTYGGTGYEEGYSVQQTSDGGYIVAGYTNSFGNGPQVYIVKTNAGGDTLWTRNYGGTGDNYGWSVQQTLDGSYIVAGSTGSFGNSYQVYLIKSNASGDTLWTKTYGGTGFDEGYSVQQTSDGGFIITGTYDEYGGNAQVYLIKTDANGNVGTERGQGFEGSRVQGVKIPPNPFISFARVPGHEGERFNLYDISGRKVGAYRGDRIGEGLGAGVYFLKYQEMLKQVQHDEIVRIVKLR